MTPLANRASRRARLSLLLASSSALPSVSLALLLSTGTANATSYNVTLATDNGDASVVHSLSWAIQQASLGSGNTVQLGTSVTVSAPLPAINASMAITGGNGIFISGGNANRVLFIESGNVTMRACKTLGLIAVTS